MAKKRISRSRKRELEAPDEFITFTGKLLRAATENRQKIISAGGVIVVLILVISGFRYYSIQTEKKAFELLQTGLDKIDKLSEGAGSEKLPADIKNDFEMVLEKYPGKKAGKLARILLADIACDTREYDLAISLYNRALTDFDGDPFYRTLILKGLAYAYEQIGDNENAQKYMETINAGPDMGFKDEVLYSLGRMASKNGQHDREIEYYQEILKSYPDSIYADIVKEKIGTRSSKR